jgi:hypothetical protein
MAISFQNKNATLTLYVASRGASNNSSHSNRFISIRYNNNRAVSDSLEQP